MADVKLPVCSALITQSRERLLSADEVVLSTAKQRAQCFLQGTTAIKQETQAKEAERLPGNSPLISCDGQGIWPRSPIDA